MGEGEGGEGLEWWGSAKDSFLYSSGGVGTARGTAEEWEASCEVRFRPMRGAGVSGRSLLEAMVRVDILFNSVGKCGGDPGAIYFETFLWGVSSYVLSCRSSGLSGRGRGLLYCRCAVKRTVTLSIGGQYGSGTVRTVFRVFLSFFMWWISLTRTGYCLYACEGRWDGRVGSMDVEGLFMYVTLNLAALANGTTSPL